MSKYKEFRKELKNVYISNEYDNFSDRLQKFLDKNPNIKILQVIVHTPFHITIIYEVSIPI